MSYQVAKLIARMAENLPDEMSEDVMQGWIENPRALQKFLSGLNPPANGSASKVEVTPAQKVFPVWKKIELGTPGLCSGEDFLKGFAKDGTNVSDWARDMLIVKDEEEKPRFTVAVQPIKLSLVKVTVAELGFTRWTRFDTICAKAYELGLDLCPEEVGPQLCRQYRDQPKGKRVVIAMKPIIDSDGDLKLFNVGHYDDGLWLVDCDGLPGIEFSPDNQLAFVPRKYQEKPLVT